MQKNYELNKVRYFKNYKEALKINAEEKANEIAISYTCKKEDKNLTFKEYYERVCEFGTSIESIGLPYGSHIAMVSPNSVNCVLSFLTIISSNNVYFPVDKDLPTDEIIGLLNHSDSVLVLTNSKFFEELKEHQSELSQVKYYICFDEDDTPVCYNDKFEIIIEDMYKDGKARIANGDRSYIDLEPKEDELGELVYTSGTTGRAKGVMLSRHNLWSIVYYGMHVTEIGKNGLAVLPFNHTYESSCDILTTVFSSARININENLKTVASNMKKYKPDYIMLVPLFVENFYKNILKSVEKQGKKEKLDKAIALSSKLRKVGIDLRKVLFKDVREIFGGNLERIVCGGAPIRPELAEFFDAIGIPLIGGYGITECSPLVAVNRIRYNNFKSCGVPLPCVQIRIEDPNEDGEGEILVKGDTVMLGYYKNEEATKEALTEDGWFHTGDYGKMIGDQLFITGRKKNLIVLKNGKNVYPEEIEEYIMRIPEVEEVLVYSKKDSDGSEIGLYAEIYPNENFSKTMPLRELDTFMEKKVAEVCKDLPTYKRVEEVVIRSEEFPKTTTRKLKRDYTK